MTRNLLQRIAISPQVYDWVQHLFGFEKGCQHMAPYLAQTDNQTVLDVGGGTGIWRPFVSQSANYVLMDIDAEKLRRFKAKGFLDQAILGDATEICLRNDSVDLALCSAVSHHLADVQWQALLSELARIVTRKLIFLDAIECRESRISNLLWKYDRGGCPRSAEAMISSIERFFEVEYAERFTIYHHYLLCVSTPKKRSLVASQI